MFTDVTTTTIVAVVISCFLLSISSPWPEFGLLPHAKLKQPPAPACSYLPVPTSLSGDAPSVGSEQGFAAQNVTMLQTPAPERRDTGESQGGRWPGRAGSPGQLPTSCSPK